MTWKQRSGKGNEHNSFMVSRSKVHGNLVALSVESCMNVEVFEKPCMYHIHPRFGLSACAHHLQRWSCSTKKIKLHFELPHARRVRKETVTLFHSSQSEFPHSSFAPSPSSTRLDAEMNGSMHACVFHSARIRQCRMRFPQGKVLPLSEGLLGTFAPLFSPSLVPKRRAGKNAPDSDVYLFRRSRN